MKRQFSQYFLTWLKASTIKPLIILGARQVGKTYFFETLAQEYVEKIHKIDFIEDKSAALIFAGEINKPEELLKKIERFLNTKIDQNNDLLFFDEIQQCPEALQSLKYFNLKLPGLKIVSAGSFLGFIANEKSFPVGYVEFLSMGPLTFAEFLENFDQDLFAFYQNLNPFDHDIIDPFYHSTLGQCFKIYLALGGLPEVVRSFLDTYKKNFDEALLTARKIQKNLLIGYQADFSKHAGTVNAVHILHVFESIPVQLAQYQDDSVKKFKFSNIIPNSKGFNKIMGPLEWLVKARLVIKTLPCNNAEEPLKAFTKENQFKLYYFDVGLLQANLNIPIQKIIDDDIGSYKGYIAENFVATELFSHTFEPLYSWNEGQAEVEFLIHKDHEITPVEVKSSTNFMRTKSLESFRLRYNPKAAIKLSPLNRGYNKEKKVHSIPIYLAGKLQKSFK